jgi:cytochrome P450
VHRDPRNFYPLPDSFWPDRWLPEADRHGPPSLTYDTTKFIHNTAAFAPFSLGTANCAGKGLAAMELRSLVCAIVQRFEFMAKEDFVLEAWPEGMKDAFVMQRPPLPVIVEARR